jgi:hypothetical protein
MIKFANQVPSIYPAASRDFQYLCWLMDIVLNSVKHNVDDIYYLPYSGVDPKLTELLATTLGFKVKRNYDQTQLRALVVVLPRILKYKGTKIAVDIAGRALLAASGALGGYRSEVRNGCELYVIFPETLVDVTLFNDLLVYILPAGMTCHVARTNLLESAVETNFDYDEKLIAEWLPDIAWDSKNQTTFGLTNMFDTPATKPVFTNYIDDLGGITPNIGLLDNNVIPMFNSNTLVGQEYVKEQANFNSSKTVTAAEDDSTDTIGGD